MDINSGSYIIYVQGTYMYTILDINSCSYFIFVQASRYIYVHNIGHQSRYHVLYFCTLYIVLYINSGSYLIYVQGTYMYTIQDINPGIKLWYDVPYFYRLYIILYINLGFYLVHRIMYLIYITYVCSTEYCTSIQVYNYLLIVLHITHLHTTYTIKLYRVLKINSGDYLVHGTIHHTYVHSTQYCILIQVVILYMVLHITYLHSTCYTVLTLIQLAIQFIVLYITYVHSTHYCTSIQDVIQYMVVYIQYKLCTKYTILYISLGSYLEHGIMYFTYVCFSNILAKCIMF